MDESYGASKEVDNLNTFFGPINWKTIADRYSPDIFINDKRDQIKSLRDELLFEYVFF